MSTPPTPKARAPEAAADLRAHCLQILTRGDLASKLAPPVDEAGRLLSLDPSGPAILLDGPARDPGLRMQGGREKLPSPGELADPARRVLCLARFAHHELMAVEYFAWALLRWPELPSGLRRGFAAALADEQRHCRLYLARLESLGGRFDGDDHSDYFWRHAPAIAASPHGPAAFLAAMGLTLEQANLDFTLTYRDGFAVAGDAESAAVCQQVHDDEIRHVALAARWLVALAPAATTATTAATAEPDDACAASAAPSPDLAAYLASVPFPLAASRAKGRRFEPAPRQRAGLSRSFIEFVRCARSAREAGHPGRRDALAKAVLEAAKPDVAPGPPRPWILANLGAEEGRDFAAAQKAPHAAIAARLFGLLFPADASLVRLQAGGPPIASSVGEHWPSALGPPSPRSVAPWWLEPGSDAVAWLHTASLRAALIAAGPPYADARLAGPSPDCVRSHHDKRFAFETACARGLLEPELADAIRVLDPDLLAREDDCIAQLESALADWPDWMQRRFTLKPRFGSSGRGRVGGRGRADSPAVRGALARLARAGGALFEPWLERTFDLSVVLRVPRDPDPPQVLASFELLATRSGVYRGHFGLLEPDGTIHSGDRDDLRAREQAMELAARAQAGGFSGPCGVDAFRYRIDGTRPGDPPREAWRGAVELNARATLGTVVWGILQRALSAPDRDPAADAPRARGDRAPGRGRRAFLFAFFDPRALDQGAEQSMLARSGAGARVLALDGGPVADAPRPLLFLADDPIALRDAYRAVTGC